MPVVMRRALGLGAEPLSGSDGIEAPGVAGWLIVPGRETVDGSKPGIADLSSVLVVADESMAEAFEAVAGGNSIFSGFAANAFPLPLISDFSSTFSVRSNFSSIFVL